MKKEAGQSKTCYHVILSHYVFTNCFIPRYTSSTLDGNPLLNPPLEVCRLGPEAIERFQGVGPNIDAEKEAEEKLRRKRRFRSISNSVRNSQGSELGGRNGPMKVKSQPEASKTANTVVEKSADSEQSVSDRRKK